MQPSIRAFTAWPSPLACWPAACWPPAAPRPPAPSAPAVPAASPIAVAPEPGFVPVARYGRYTLVELVPEPAQRDLLQQAVEVTIPPMLDASVGDAMRHVLLRSGYRLCDAAEAAALYALPLPAAHLRLGPADAARCLAGLAGPPGSCRSMTRPARSASAGTVLPPSFPPTRPAPPRPCRTPTARGGAAMTFPQAPSERNSPHALAQDRRGRLAAAHQCTWPHQQRRPVAAHRTDPEQRTGCPGQALGLRVAELEQQADADKRRPVPISQAEFANARQALDERLTRLERPDRPRTLPSTCRRCRRA
jgi:conjugative transfer region protein (TIGR03748 family)